jgi:hypothetical protein
MSLPLALPPRQIIREWNLQTPEDLTTVVLLMDKDDPPVQIVLDSRPILFRTLDAQAALKSVEDDHGSPRPTLPSISTVSDDSYLLE